MKRFLNLISIIAITLTVSGCAGKTNEEQVATEQEVYQNTKTGDTLKIVKDSMQEGQNLKKMRVGILLPLTGANANLGKQLLDSSQLAIYDLQADNLNIVPINTEASADVIAKKIDAAKVDVILGPLYSNDTKKIYPIAEQKNLCMISFSNDDNLSGKNCLFLLGVMPDESVKRVVDYSLNNGVEEVYAVLPDSKYGAIVESHLAKFNTDEQTKTKVIAKYSTKTFSKDVSQASVNILAFARGNSALLIPESGNIVNSINTHLTAKQASLSNYRLLGTGLWDNEKVAENKALEGAIFASPPKQFRDSFERRFHTHYGYNPSKLATLSYDAVALVKALSGNGKTEINRERLLNQHGFKGVTGLFRFTTAGLNERTLSIFSIKQGKIVEIEPAPQSF